MLSELPIFAAGTARDRVDLDDRQIGLLINADYFGIVLNAWWIVLQANANAIRFVHYVAIGDECSPWDRRSHPNRANVP